MCLGRYAGGVSHLHISLIYILVVTSFIYK